MIMRHTLQHLLLLLGTLLLCHGTAQAQLLQNLQDQVTQLQGTLQRHDQLLQRIQQLTAEQARRQNELSRLSLTAEDIDAMRRDLQTLERTVLVLQDQLTELQQKREQSTSADRSDSEPLVIGLLALQSGDVNRAVDHLQPLLTSKSDYRKDDLLMVLGNGFLQAGYPEQAASHLSTLIRTHPASQHLPAAMFSLGQAFYDMRDNTRQFTVWKALIEEYPDHPMAEKAARALEAQLR